MKQGLSIEEVKFDWSHKSSAHSGIQLISSNDNDALGPLKVKRDAAVYSIQSIKKGREVSSSFEPKICVHATFHWTGPSAKPVQVSAFPVTQKELSALDIGTIKSTSESVIGYPDETNVLFDSKGRSVYCGDNPWTPFSLEEIKLHEEEFGVDIYQVFWHWKYREIDPKTGKPNSETWTSIEIRCIKVYLLLDEPKFPWTAQGVRRRTSPVLNFPWEQALELACLWAKGCKTIDQAAVAVTKSLHAQKAICYQTGPQYVKIYTDDAQEVLQSWNHPGTEWRVVSKRRYLNLSRFLRDLADFEGSKHEVNCDDCAYIVASLANLLGCDLWVGRLQGTAANELSYGVYLNAFLINQVKEIGGEMTTHGHFNYHTIAWQRSERNIEMKEIIETHLMPAEFIGDTQIKVYDACLAFEELGWQCAQGTPLDSKGHSGYRAMLGKLDHKRHEDSENAACHCHGYARCLPQANTVERLAVF